MTEPCVACAKHTPNFVDADAGKRVYACNIGCYHDSRRPLAQLTDAERRTARPLPDNQRAALQEVPATVRVMAYVPQRPSATLPIAADNGAIYLQARRLPDGSLVVDRFENYTTPGHSWRTALVRAVPQRSAPQAVHAVPPPPTPTQPQTPALALSAPIGACVSANAHPVHLVAAPASRALACGHQTTLALAWPGTSQRAPQQFCGAQCAEKHIGAPVRVVSDIGAALLAPATGTTWLTLPESSPLLRIYKLHPQLRAPAPNMIHAPLAQEAARAIAQHRLAPQQVGAPGGGDDDELTDSDDDLFEANMAYSDDDLALTPVMLLPAKTPSAFAPVSPVSPASPARSPLSSSSTVPPPLRPSKRPSDAGAGGRPKVVADDPLATLSPAVLRAAMKAVDATAGNAAEEIQRKADADTRNLAAEWWNNLVDATRMPFVLELAASGHAAEVVAILRRDPGLVRDGNLEKIYAALRKGGASAAPLLDVLEDDDRAVLAQLALAAGDASTVTYAVSKMTAEERARFNATVRSVPPERREALRSVQIDDLVTLVTRDQVEEAKALAAELRVAVDDVLRDNKSLLQLAVDADAPLVTRWAATQSTRLNVTKGRDKHTILTAAIVARRMRALYGLLEVGIKVGAVDVNKLAAAEEWPLVLAILDRRVGKLTEEGENMLRAAAGTGSLVFVLLDAKQTNGEIDRVATLRSLIAWGASVRGTGANDTTALHLAAMRNLADAVPLLVQAGVPIDETTLPFRVANTDAGSETALFIAVRMGHVEAARALLAAGANIDIPNLVGFTVLQLLNLAPSDKPVPRSSIRRNRDEMARLFAPYAAAAAASPPASPGLSQDISSRVRFVPL